MAMVWIDVIEVGEMEESQLGLPSSPSGRSEL